MKPREIVLAVIVVLLLAIAGVAWWMAKQRDASGVASARNLQQWGIALNLYLIDNENQLPDVGKDPITSGQKDAWFNALPPYLSQAPLADLPPDERPKPGDASLWIDPLSRPPRVWDPEVFYFNYGMNRFLQPDEGVRSYRVNELGRPGNVIFLTEVDGYEPSVTPATVSFRPGVRPTSAGAVANVLFCDGHVAPVTRGILDDPETMRAETAETGVSWFAE